ncbi:phosphoserine phosphatase SerB [Prosthecodimorpha staleyi]|uniref:Phosphoserine phosphatase n=1 Tax=Prosthecodimorpha staleyi TaxID=2840188 RepID=A0A947DAC0_9HYPH|nr:phosphoserine phosphatase SerB [Prosthecodimorpha staleyi]MBT9291427.1 phosphoserine phosphatase SerB [Prosthecodimorpha staleyi]
MTHVATLISSPAAPALTPEAIAAARRRLGSGDTVPLDPGVAADLHFVPAAGTDPETDLRITLAGLPLDIVVQPVEGRRKRLLIADMDSTMIGQECIDELAAEIGIKDHVAAITERAMRGELAFEPALRERVGLLAGIDAGVVDRIIAARITLTPGGPELVRTMRANGAYTALVSGGFTVFTGPIAGRIGFDENRANTLLAEDGRLVGRVAEPILGAEAKLASLHELATTRDIPMALTLAVGDGANDLPMLQAAGLGVAFRAKPKVAAAAAARIEHADLTALLYLQGYRRAEFVAA